MVQTVGGILFLLGTISTVASIGWMASLEYPIPPIPAGWIAGVIAIIIGSAMFIGSFVIMIKVCANPKRFPAQFMLLLIASMITSYGIWEVVFHPLELPECPCPQNFYGAYPCLPCPSSNGEVCGGKGFCDDGAQGSGDCLCDVGWGGDTCTICAPTFTGSNCDKCKRGWDGDKCDVCYPGYTGSNCDICAAGWIPETDMFGTLCRTCKPGYWGGYCKTCRQCETHDPLAVCRDNVWHEDNIYNADLCTVNGNTCGDKYDCDSFNCKGVCALGDITTGELCEFDGDCSIGECLFKQCCLEKRHGDGNCECGSIGYSGEDCQACPGFDGVYSATICTGHGTCAEELVDGVYVGLRCACAKDGVDPFPVWTGSTCSCLKDSLEDEDCTECATGSYGTQCKACPGGSGIGQCNTHGKCDDGVSGAGTCECDIDVKFGGIGAFKGASCGECLSDDFYSDQCKVCPNLKVVGCPAGGFLATLPGSGGNQCIMSCGSKTCNTDTGVCQ